MKKIDDLKVIVYHRGSAEKEIVRKFLNLPEKDYIPFDSDDELNSILKKLQDHGHGSKECLVLAPFKGRYFQMCPKSPEVICCNYRLINTAFDCLFNCAYCYLQVYLNTFGIWQFSNMDDVFTEVDNFLNDMDENIIYRVGTGNYTDSLMIDDFTRITEDLIKKISRFPNVILEVKSKSDNIDHLLDIPHKGKTVMAWSLNTQVNIDLYEEGTASLDNRIRAASRAVKAGYHLAFHFDPIIIYPGWERDYSLLLEKLFNSVDPEKIMWISLGGFRYTPEFLNILRDNFPHEKMSAEEMFPGVDGKYRYYMKKREKIYHFFKNEITKYSLKPYIYMCMESKDMWKRIFNKDFNNCEEFELEFSDYIKKNFL